MPTSCWKVGDTWHCRWGSHGKIYKSKSKSDAKRKADAQGRAAYASGYKGK